MQKKGCKIALCGEFVTVLVLHVDGQRSDYKWGTQANQAGKTVSPDAEGKEARCDTAYITLYSDSMTR